MFILTEILSLAEGSNGFALPVFTSNTSNFLFVQNLDRYGNVKSFCKILDTGEKRLNHLPPHLSLEVGDMGILAFVDESNILHVGTITELRKLLSTVEVSSPFVAMEIASLTNNISMHKTAAKECAGYFLRSGTAETWLKREMKSFRIGQILDQGPHDDDNPSDRYSDQIEELSRNFEHEKWNNIWLRLWKQGYQKTKLADLASIRLDAGHAPGRDGPGVFSEILSERFGRNYTAKAIECLEGTGLDSDQWVQLYNQVSRQSPAYRDALREIGISALRRAATTPFGRTSRWLNLMSRMIRETRFSDEHRSVLMDISLDRIESSDLISNTAAEILIIPFLGNIDNRRIFDSAYRWAIRSKRSTNAWCEIFLSLIQIDRSHSLVESGIEWLQSLGGNVVRWRQVWKSLEAFLPRDHFRSIAFGWLYRARWDMGVWVLVFHDLLEDSEQKERGQLRDLANRWLSGGFGNLSTRTRMKRARDYLEAILD